MKKKKKKNWKMQEIFVLYDIRSEMQHMAAYLKITMHVD